MRRPEQGDCFYCQPQKYGCFTVCPRKIDPEDVYNQLVATWAGVKIDKKKNPGLSPRRFEQPTEQQLSSILLPKSDNVKADILNNLERKMVSSSINSSGRQLWSVFRSEE